MASKQRRCAFVIADSLITWRCGPFRAVFASHLSLTKGSNRCLLAFPFELCGRGYGRPWNGETCRVTSILTSLVKVLGKDHFSKVLSRSYHRLTDLMLPPCPVQDCDHRKHKDTLLPLSIARSLLFARDSLRLLAEVEVPAVHLDLRLLPACGRAVLIGQRSPRRQKERKAWRAGSRFNVARWPGGGSRGGLTTDVSWRASQGRVKLRMKGCIMRGS